MTPALQGKRGLGSRSFGTGSRRLLVLCALGLLVTAGGATAAVLTRSGSAANRYGGIPRWLPKAKVPVGRTLVATPAQPALGIEGDTVSVRLARGRVLATAVGPQIPEEGKVPVPPTSPCSFVVTLARGSRDVPLSTRAFTIVDELGRLHRPHVTMLGGGRPPRRLPAGKTVSLKISDVLPTGSGTLNWAPVGRKPIASWDFDVEID